MNEKGMLYGREVEVAPFVVVRVAWQAVDSDESAISMNAFSWMGWMARPPLDWTGALENLALCAPPGTRCELGALAADLSSDDVAEKAGRSIIFPMKPPGINAPWIDSEESEYRNRDSVRLLCLGIDWIVETPIPREFSQDWCDELDRKYLTGSHLQLEAALARSGFGQIEFFGIFEDLSGCSYWGNVAVEKWPGWVARKERESLEEAVVANGLIVTKPTL